LRQSLEFQLPRVRAWDQKKARPHFASCPPLNRLHWRNITVSSFETRTGSCGSRQSSAQKFVRETPAAAIAALLAQSPLAKGRMPPQLPEPREQEALFFAWF
jgi:hypothetical protein